jgi:hypothetical protein
MSQLEDITWRKEQLEDSHSRLLATVCQAAVGIAPMTVAALYASYRNMKRLRDEELQLIASGKLSEPRVINSHTGITATLLPTHSENPPETASDAPGPVSAPATLPNASDA